MATLQKKIDFMALLSVTRANCNGDPLDGNRPRTDYDGFGEMSDVCIKRKIRNRMQDMGRKIFVEMEERSDFKSLKDKAEQELGKTKSTKGKKKKGSSDSGLTKEEFYKKACETYLDVRSFGQVFAYSSTKDSDGDSDGVSVGVRGPVSLHYAISVDPVEIESTQITKSINGNDSEKKGKDTMGMKHFVRFGLYQLKGSINVQLAEKTGFSEEDAEVVKQCLRTLFVNDASSARPDGSMEVVKLFWWEHNCKEGQYSSAKVHRSVHVKCLDESKDATSADDYEITVDELPNLSVEVIDGI